MSLKIARSVAALVCLLFAGQAHAAGDVAAGKQKAEVCLACHGEHGVTDMPEVPAWRARTTITSNGSWSISDRNSGKMTS